MLNETGTVCVAIVFFNCAFKNCNKRTPQYTQYVQGNCMTDFKLSEPDEDFFFYLDDASCHELLTNITPSIR